MIGFEDRLLMKLKRKYTRDEEVGLLVQKLKRVEVENGELRSRIAELEYQLKGLKNKMERYGKQ